MGQTPASPTLQAMTLSASDESELNALLASLLKGRPPALSPGEGDEALQQHKLLAAAIHRASGLAAYGSESETDGWVRFVTEHFPEGKNDSADARRLFGDWRTSLLKKGTPGPRVLVTHGQSSTHWISDGQRRLCINLEDMWGDFEHAAAHFVESLKVNEGRRKVVLDRWRLQAWDVVRFSALAGATVIESAHAVTAGRPPPADDSTK